jgi:hypothetical protein
VLEPPVQKPIPVTHGLLGTVELPLARYCWLEQYSLSVCLFSGSESHLILCNANSDSAVANSVFPSDLYLYLMCILPALCSMHLFCPDRPERRDPPPVHFGGGASVTIRCNIHLGRPRNSLRPLEYTDNSCVNKHNTGSWLVHKDSVSVRRMKSTSSY